MDFFAFMLKRFVWTTDSDRMGYSLIWFTRAWAAYPW